MTIKYITDSETANLSNVKVKEDNLNIQYNSNFISNSNIDLNITNYSICIYERYIHSFIYIYINSQLLLIVILSFFLFKINMIIYLI